MSRPVWRFGGRQGGQGSGARTSSATSRPHRFPGVRQRDVSDCGAACLVAVARFHGRRASVAGVRRLAQTDHRGASLLNLAAAAEQLGLEARGVRAPFASLGSLPLPAVAHIEREDGASHFVVLCRVAGARILIMDPAVGRSQWVVDADFAREWTRVLLLLEPRALGGTARMAASWRSLRPGQPALHAILAIGLAAAALAAGVAVRMEQMGHVRLGDRRLGSGRQMLAGAETIVVMLVLAITGGTALRRCALRTMCRALRRMSAGLVRGGAATR